MSRHRRGELLPIVVALAAAYSAGTLTALVGGGEWWLSSALWLLGGIAVLAWRPRTSTLVLVAVLAVIAGGAHGRLTDVISRPASPLAVLAGTHEISGTARSDARIFGTLARVDLNVDRVDAQALDGGLRLTVPARDPILQGDRVTATVEVEPLNLLEDADIADRLRSIGLDATAAFPDRWSVEATSGQSFAGRLAALRRLLVRHIERALPEPESGLAAGVLVGERVHSRPGSSRT